MIYKSVMLSILYTNTAFYIGTNSTSVLKNMERAPGAGGGEEGGKRIPLKLVLTNSDLSG